MSISTLAIVAGLLGPFTVADMDKAFQENTKETAETQNAESVETSRIHQFDWYDIKIRAGEELEIRARLSGQQPVQISLFEPGSKSPRYTFEAKPNAAAFKRILRQNGTYRIRVKMTEVSRRAFVLKTKIKRARATKRAPSSRLDFLSL